MCVCLTSFLNLISLTVYVYENNFSFKVKEVKQALLGGYLSCLITEIFI